MAQRLADAGYVVALPNLYHRSGAFPAVRSRAGGGRRSRTRSLHEHDSLDRRRHGDARHRRGAGAPRRPAERAPGSDRHGRLLHGRRLRAPRGRRVPGSRRGRRVVSRRLARHRSARQPAPAGRGHARPSLRRGGRHRSRLHRRATPSGSTRRCAPPACATRSRSTRGRSTGSRCTTTASTTRPRRSGTGSGCWGCSTSRCGGPRPGRPDGISLALGGRASPAAPRGGAMRAARTACLVILCGAAMTTVAAAEPAQRGRGPAAPACTTVACDVQGDWERTKNLVIGLVNAMPDDKFGFKPTPRAGHLRRARDARRADRHGAARDARRARRRRRPSPTRRRRRRPRSWRRCRRRSTTAPRSSRSSTTSSWPSASRRCHSSAPPPRV